MHTDTDRATAEEREGHLTLEFAGSRIRFAGPTALLEQLAGVPCALPVQGTAQEATLPAACQIAALPPAPEPRARPLGRQRLEWAWQGMAGWLRSAHATAELQSCNGAVRASARLTPNRRGAESLLLSLSAALLHLRGGLILHAAALELAGSVVALVGPSGAGKSTTCRQQLGCKLFSVDRLAVAPSDSGTWRAFPMPGGTSSPLDLPPSSLRSAPLLAILRVRKAAGGCSLVDCAPLEAVALLRQCAFHPGLEVSAELELLAHLQRLARDVPVANLHSALGTLLAEPLGRWLSRRPPSGAEGQHFA